MPSECFEVLHAEETLPSEGIRGIGINTLVRFYRRKEVHFLPSIGFGTKCDEGLVFFTLFPFII